MYCNIVKSSNYDVCNNDWMYWVLLFYLILLQMDSVGWKYDVKIVMDEVFSFFLELQLSVKIRSDIRINLKYEKQKLPIMVLNKSIYCAK